MIPATEITVPILREIELVRAWLPWLPEIGVRVRTVPFNNFYYTYDDASRAHYIEAPNTPYDAQTLRRVIRHECGHLWEKVLGLRVPGFSPFAGLGVDTSLPLPNEVVADIFARTMGEQPSYPDLEPRSRPTPERTAFIEASGRLPDRLEEQVMLAQAIGAFWQREDIDPYFRDWANNYQTWLDLNVLRWLGMVD